MKRNQKEERRRYLKNLEREKDKLPYTSYHPRGEAYEWVPVDEPHHIGWEMSLKLSDLSLRRPDVHLLKEVMDVLGWDKPYWTTDMRVVKLIRRAGKRVSTYRSLYYEYYRKHMYTSYYYRDAPGLDVRKTLSDDKYAKLAENLKKYFTVYDKYHAASPWKDAWIERLWQLNSYFPQHDMVIKLDKAYSTHRGIPKATEWSRRQEIEEKLDQELWYAKEYGTHGKYGVKWEHRREVHACRKRWNSILNVAVKYKKKHIPQVVDGLQGKHIKYKQ